MTTSTIPSFIDAALTNATQQKSSFATLANMAESRNEKHFANRIGGAWADLVNTRNNLRVLDLEDGGSRVKDMPVKPEPFLSFCQYVMNQACWAARRYVQAQQSNADHEAIAGITGIDFSQDVAADMGIEPLSTDEIKEALDTDFSAMLKLYSILSTKMNYLQDIEDLHMYADRQQEGENWRVVATADSFDEALEVMNEVITRMKEREDASLLVEMATTDFAEAS